MEPFIVGTKVLSIMGTDIIIKGLTATTSSIGSLMKNIYSYDKPGADEVKKQLDEIDLQYMINIMEELVKECSRDDLPISVKKSIEGVTYILDKIDDELRDINESINEHKKKYFNRWRGFNCKYSINSIKYHKNLLDQRYKILIDLLMIYHNK